MDFVKDHQELYDKTNKHFKDKARKKYLWERFTNSHKLSVKVYKIWFKSQRTRFDKLTQSKSCRTAERQNWIQEKFNFLKLHLRCKGLSKSSGCKSRPEQSVHLLPQHTTSPEGSMEIRMGSDTTIQPAQFPSILLLTSRSWTSFVPSQCSHMIEVVFQYVALMFGLPQMIPVVTIW